MCASNSFSEKVVKGLEGIGLTQYELSLYLTLIKEGPLNAKDLSDKSGVPYSRIYNILAMLLDKGFLVRDDTQRPSTFVANPPDEALMLARKKVMDDFNRFSKDVVEELNDLYLKNVDAPFQLTLLVYRGKEAVFTKATTLLENANHSILVATNDLNDLIEAGIIDRIRERNEKGVTDIKILIEQNPASLMKARETFEGLGEIRQRDQIFGTGIAIDGVDAIIILKARIFTFESYFGMKSDHEAFGPIAQQYFDYLFDSASKID